MIIFALLIEPKPKLRPRFGRGRTYTPAQTVRYERDLQKLASKMAPPEPLSGPIEVSLLFQVRKPKRCKREVPSVKPDIDNYVKAVSDAFNNLFWHDDGQITCIYARKRYGLVPMIHVQIGTHRELRNAMRDELNGEEE